LFLGYCVLELPSNSRSTGSAQGLWLARIMITWGLISAAMIFTVGPKSFSRCASFWRGGGRLLPWRGLLLTAVVPGGNTGRAIYAWFLIGIPASSLIGGPLSGFLLELDERWGSPAWKWLFLTEGLPPSSSASCCLLLLVEKPDQANWLSAEEKALVRQAPRLREEGEGSGISGRA